MSARTSAGVWKVAAAGAVSLGAIAALSGVASAAPNVCVSTMGVVRHQTGTATCESFNAVGTLAIAVGDGASAQVYGGDLSPWGGETHERALAVGDNTSAFVAFADRSSAKAIGDGSRAAAYLGADLTAMVIGDGSSAEASDSQHSSAVVIGDGSRAGAGVHGANNTAVVIGDGSSAGAGVGYDNTAVVIADDSHAQALDGDDNTVVITSDGCTVSLDGVSGQTATC